jgi:hydrogenase maturation protease
VLGLGNPILTDDGVGIYVVRAVQARMVHMTPRPNIEFAEAGVGGFRLLEVLTGYDRVLLVDAIVTETSRPGSVHRLKVDDLRASLHSGSTHDLTLADALVLGRRLGLKLPDDDQITIVAVEAADVLTFGESCTPEVAAEIPAIAQMVAGEIGRM